MIGQITVENRGGIIAICLVGMQPLTGELISMPIMTFDCIEKFRDYVDMLNRFLVDKGTPIPDYIKEAFQNGDTVV